MLLEWVASTLCDNPEVEVHTIIAIPYNLFHPGPYNWWPKKKMLEVGTQLKIAEEFWNFLAGGNDVYGKLLDCFEHVGCRLSDEIDAHFEKFNISDNHKKT